MTSIKEVERARNSKRADAEKWIIRNFPDLKSEIRVSGDTLRVSWLELNARKSIAKVAYCDGRGHEAVWLNFHGVEFCAGQKLAELAKKLLKRAEYSADVDGAGWVIWL